MLLYHIGGPNACHKPAISVIALPNRYEIAADNVVKLDGTIPLRGEAMICGSCKGQIIPAWLSYKHDRIMRGG
jgi:hypothetical protein